MKSTANNGLGTLDVLCPLHVQMDHDKNIIHAGPTISKLRPGGFEGCNFWEVFEFIRPKNVWDVNDVKALIGKKLHLQFRDRPKTPFKGVIAIGNHAVIINLSIGIGVAEAV